MLTTVYMLLVPPAPGVGPRGMPPMMPPNMPPSMPPNMPPNMPPSLPPNMPRMPLGLGMMGQPLLGSLPPPLAMPSPGGMGRRSPDSDSMDVEMEDVQKVSDKDFPDPPDRRHDTTPSLSQLFNKYVDDQEKKSAQENNHSFKDVYPKIITDDNRREGELYSRLY